MADNNPDISVSKHETGKLHDELSGALKAANEQHIANYNNGNAPMKAAVAGIEHRPAGHGSPASVITSSVTCPPEDAVNKTSVNDVGLIKSAAEASNFSNIVREANLELPLTLVKYDGATSHEILARCTINYMEADLKKKEHGR